MRIPGRRKVERQEKEKSGVAGRDGGKYFFENFCLES
jgi:hypothetical protein